MSSQDVDPFGGYSPYNNSAQVREQAVSIYRKITELQSTLVDAEYRLRTADGELLGRSIAEEQHRAADALSAVFEATLETLHVNVREVMEQAASAVDHAAHERQTKV